MRKRLAAYLLLLFLAYLVFYISRHYQEFKPLTEVNPGYLLIIAVGHLSGIYLNGLFVKFILEPFKKTISSKESFTVSLISTVGNYFLPVGTGTGVKAVYLKKKFKLSYTDFMATLSGNYILVFLLNSFIGLVALYLLRRQAPTSQFTVLALALGVIFAGMLVMATIGFPSWLLAKLQNTKQLKRYTSIISNILNGWNTITRNRGLLLRLLMITLLNFFISIGITYVAVVSLGFDIKASALVLYTALGSLSFLLNVTPGSIGIRESIYIFSSAILGLTIPEILSVSIIDKSVLFFVLLISWLLIQTGVIKKTVTQ
jgi:uncharacterized protein (TIRG00374 family)